MKTGILVYEFQTYLEIADNNLYIELAGANITSDKKALGYITKYA